MATLYYYMFGNWMLEDVENGERSNSQNMKHVSTVYASRSV